MEARAVRGWRVFGTLPFAAAVLVAVNAAYILLVALGNITDYGTNFAFVQHVLSMDTTNFGQPEGEGLDPDVMWRAIDHPVAWHAGYIGIIVAELLAATLLLVACVHFVRAFLGKAGFERARIWGTAGLSVMMLVFAGGFIAVGGEWFQMWRSVDWNGLEPAFRNAVLAGLGLVLLHLPSPAWQNAAVRENPPE